MLLQFFFYFCFFLVGFSLLGDTGRLLKGARVQLPLLLPLLLSFLRNRAAKIWPARMEPQLPLQQRRPHHLNQCAIQLFRGQHQSIYSFLFYV